MADLSTLAARLFLADPCRPGSGPWASLPEGHQRPYLAMAQAASDHAQRALSSARNTEIVLRGEIRRSESALADFDQMLKQRGAAEVVLAAVNTLADENAEWEWQAPVGTGNASYANGYENGRRAVGADLRHLLLAALPGRDPLSCPPDGGCPGCSNWPERCVCDQRNLPVHTPAAEGAPGAIHPGSEPTSSAAGPNVVTGSERVSSARSRLDTLGGVDR